MASGSYYSIAIQAMHVTTAAYYQLDPSLELSIMQGGFTCYPTATSSTSVAVYPQLVQLNFPPAEYVGGSATIQTEAPVISGNFLVSPAISSPVNLTLYGAGGQVLGTATLEAGQDSVSFSWNVSSSQAMSLDEAKQSIESSLQKQ